MSPSEPRRIAAAATAPSGLRGPVAEQAPPREVAGEREREADGRVEVGAGDVADRVDHGHDHKAEGDRDPDLAEGALGLGVDHDGAATGEDQREGADRLGQHRTRERALGQASGRSSPIRLRTR